MANVIKYFKQKTASDSFTQYDFGVSDPKYINVSGDGNLQNFIDRINKNKVFTKEIKQDSNNPKNTWIIEDSSITENMWPILYETSVVTFQKKTLTTENGKITVSFESNPPKNYTATIVLIAITNIL